MKYLITLFFLLINTLSISQYKIDIIIVKKSERILYAVKDDKVYVIEANPRTTRTVPFLAKANEVPEAKIGVKVMLGAKLKEFDTQSKLKCWAIKEPGFPFDKFPGVKKEVGPEMKSTGESIYFAEDFNDEHFRKPFEFKSLYLSK